MGYNDEINQIYGDGFHDTFNKQTNYLNILDVNYNKCNFLDLNNGFYFFPDCL